MGVAVLKILAVGLGGAIGAIARYVVVVATVKLWGERFPYATLIVNTLGSFVMGVLFSLIFDKVIVNEFWRLLLVVGFLGALTTFSSFSLETVSLIQNQHLFAAAINTAANLILCLILSYLGVELGRTIHSMR